MDVHNVKAVEGWSGSLKCYNSILSQLSGSPSTHPSFLSYYAVPLSDVGIV